MKKIKWLFVMMVFVTVGAVCIAFIVKNEKNKQAPIERYYEKMSLKKIMRKIKREKQKKKIRQIPMILQRDIVFNREA